MTTLFDARCKRIYLMWDIQRISHQLSLCNLIYFSTLPDAGDLPVGGRPEDQPVAHGDYRPVVQHRRHQACQHGGAHRGGTLPEMAGSGQ